MKGAINGDGYAGYLLLSTSSGSLKTELYNAPRRSLRQKGLDPDGSGLPYYSPPKPRMSRDENGVRDSADKNSDEGKTDMEIGDESPLSDSVVDGNVKGQSSTGSINTPREGSAKIALKNVSVRRQIIRPWEDTRDQSSQATPAGEKTSLPVTPLLGLSNNLRTSSSESKVQMNGRTPLVGLSNNLRTSSSESRVQMNGHRRKNSSISNVSEVSQGSYSVQTAAEALVEMGWSTPNSKEGTSTEEETYINMDVDKTHPASESVLQTEELPVTSGTSASSLLSHNVAKDVTVTIDHERLLALFDRVTKSTDKCTVKQLERLYSVFEHLVFRYRMMVDRNALIQVCITIIGMSVCYAVCK